MYRLVFSLIALLLISPVALGQDCLMCHKNLTPGAVADWEASKHAEKGVTCNVCHGEQHA